MKAYFYSMIGVLFVAVAMTAIIGCEYDVAQPQWENDYVAPATPRITQIQPDSVATAGWNIITIRGENFAAAPNINDVYFGVLPAEIVASSSTSITVRRPNLTDTCTVKVVSHSALLVAKYHRKYRIAPVLERYGGFRDNIILGAVAVDQAENLYVVYGDSAVNARVFKVTPDGQRRLLGRSPQSSSDARIGPGGQLYLVGRPTGFRDIFRMDVETGATTRWHRLAASKPVKFGDFDAFGYFYAGGTRTDLMIITPDSTNRTAGFYSTQEILAVRVYEGYVYVAARAPVSGTAPPNPASIWRHAIGAGGALGPQELVIDFSGTAYASRTIRGLTFSSTGTTVIGTDSSDPFLIAPQSGASGQVDIFYKSILPPYCKGFYWGTGTNLYMISGNTNPAQEWTIYRVDIGTTGAPYWGR